MRIRNYRQQDLPTLVQIQQEAAQADGCELQNADSIEEWLTNSEMDALSNAFVIMDDDDELNTWGQAGTLDSLEGEIVGYTTLELRQDQHAYHLLCQGAVHPQYRRQNAGRLLLVGALNRARIMGTEFEFEAEQEGTPVYFEALLPVRDPASPRLAAKCEMQPTNEDSPEDMRLYRRELWL